MWTAAARAAAAASHKSSGLKGGTLLQLAHSKARKAMEPHTRRDKVMKDFKSRRTARALVAHMEGKT